MLRSAEIKQKDSAVKCLEVLSTSKPHHWKSILEAGTFMLAPACQMKLYKACYKYLLTPNTSSL